MIVRLIVRVLGAAAVALPWRMVRRRSSAAAARRPATAAASAAAVALATQLLELKGGIGAFDPAIEGVITHHKGNPAADQSQPRQGY